MAEIEGELVVKYAYPEDGDYYYEVVKYEHEGMVWYVGSCNSGSGIGADYLEFESEDLDEVVGVMDAHLEYLVDIDFKEEVLMFEDKHKDYEVQYIGEDGCIFANIFKKDKFINAIFGQNLEELRSTVATEYFK